MRRTKSGERGFALIFVLWAVSVLFLLASGFSSNVRAYALAGAAFKDINSARYLALSGINLAASELHADYDTVLLGADGSTVLARGAEGLLNREARRPAVTAGGGGVSYGITDECSKVNLNTAERPVVIRLLASLGVAWTEADIIADSLLDWRDENHEYRLNGAEDDYYASIGAPYQAKDGPLDSIDELSLIRGMDKPLFERLKPLVTVWGDGRVNYNTASEAVLTAAFGDKAASDVLFKRRTGGVYPGPLDRGSGSCAFFSVSSRSGLNGYHYSVEAVVERRATAPRLIVHELIEGRAQAP